MHTGFKIYVLPALIGFFAIGCTSHTSVPATTDWIHGQIEILSIKKRNWTDEIGPEILARGDYLVTVRFILPQQYRIEATDLPVVRLSDLAINGVSLQPGDIVDFDASEEMFAGAAKPYVFTNLRNLQLAATKRHD